MRRRLAIGAGITGSRVGALAAALAALLLLAPPPARSQALSPEVQEILQKGIAAARQQQWLLAVQQFNAAFDKSPTSPEILFNLALANDRMGDHELQAITWYRAYLAVAPAAGNGEQVAARVAALEAAVHANARGLVDKAIAANAQLPTGDRSNATYSIAYAQARANDPAAVFATVATAGAGKVVDADAGYAGVTEIFARIGNLAAAEDAVRRVGTSEKRDEALHGIVSGLADSGRISEALAYADNIHGTYRALAYGRIAKQRIQQKDMRGAADTLALAVDAYHRMPKEQQPYNVADLIEIAGTLDNSDLAKRLFDEKAWTGDALKYHRPQVASSLAMVLIKTRRLSEAEALIPTISPDPNDWWRKRPASELAQARSGELSRLIEARNLPQAESLLAKLPRGEQSARQYIDIADGYLKTGNNAAAKRVLAAGEKIFAAGPGGAAARVGTIGALARAYLGIGDEADAQRLLDGLIAPAVLKAIAAGKDGQTDVRSIAEQLVRLARAQAWKGDLPAARITAGKAIKIAALIKEAPARASELRGLGAWAVKLNLANELMAAVAGAPGSSDRDTIYGDLAESYSAAGDVDAVLAVASQIGDDYGRSRALSLALAARAKIGDWQGAARFTADASRSAELNAELALSLAKAGRQREAAALEPKFIDKPSSVQDAYLSWLVLAQAQSGDFEAAIRTALRRSTPQQRIAGVGSVASTANTYSGSKPALAIYARAVSMFGYLSPADRLSFCNDTGSLRDELDAGAATYAVAQTCLKNALAIPDRAARIKAVQKAADLMIAADRPPPPILVSQLIADAAPISNDYDRHSDISSALAILDKNGATETLNALWRDSGLLAEKTDLGNRARALAAAGNAAEAQTVIRRWTQAAAATSDGDRDSNYVAIIKVLITLRDFSAASALVSRIGGERSRFDALLALTTAMPSSGRDADRIGLVQQAAADARAVGAPYYLSNLGVNAARAGDFALAGSLIDEGGEVYRLGGYRSLARILLLAGNRDELPAVIDKLRAAYASAGITGQWLNAGGVATILAWAGDSGRLDQLLAGTVSREAKLNALIGAADGLAKAGSPEAAREALRRALAVFNIERPDFDAWAAQRIAIAEAEVDPEKAIADMAAVADADLRSRGAVEMAKQFFADGKGALAVALLKKIPAAPLLDPTLGAAARHRASAGALADARSFAGKISDPVLRDYAYRAVVLIEARRGETAAALADARSVADAVARAYLLVDLAALLAERGSIEPAKAADAAALRLAASIADLPVKADVITAVARNEIRIGSAAASAAKAQALAAAQAIADPEARAVALRWAEGGKLADVWNDDPSLKLASEIKSKWQSYINYELKDDLYSGIDPFVRSLAAKTAPQIVAALADAAGQLETRLRELRKMSDDWATAHGPSAR